MPAQIERGQAVGAALERGQLVGAGHVERRQRVVGAGDRAQRAAAGQIERRERAARDIERCERRAAGELQALQLAAAGHVELFELGHAAQVERRDLVAAREQLTQAREVLDAGHVGDLCDLHFKQVDALHGLALGRRELVVLVRVAVVGHVFAQHRVGKMRGVDRDFARGHRRNAQRQQHHDRQQQTQRLFEMFHRSSSCKRFQNVGLVNVSIVAGLAPRVNLRLRRGGHVWRARSQAAWRPCRGNRRPGRQCRSDRRSQTDFRQRRRP